MAVVTNIVGAGAIVSYFGLIFYLIRVFNISVPAFLVPWSSPLSKVIYSNQVIRILLVAFNIFDSNGTQALAEVLVLFFLQLGQCAYRLMITPYFYSHLDILIKSRDIAVALLFFLGLLCKLVEDSENYDLAYFIIIFPFLVFATIAYETQRRQLILKKLKSNTLKMEVENEYALHILMGLVKDVIAQKDIYSNSLGQLIDLIHGHIQQCDDVLCVCEHLEGYYEFMQLKQA